MHNTFKIPQSGTIAKVPMDTTVRTYTPKTPYFQPETLYQWCHSFDGVPLDVDDAPPPAKPPTSRAKSIHRG